MAAQPPQGQAPRRTHLISQSDLARRGGTSLHRIARDCQPGGPLHDAVVGSRLHLDLDHEATKRWLRQHEGAAEQLDIDEILGGLPELEDVSVSPFAAPPSKMEVPLVVAPKPSPVQQPAASAPQPKPAKSAWGEKTRFVREHPDLSAQDLLVLAAQHGIPLTLGYIYNRRAADKSKSKARRPRFSEPVAAVPAFRPATNTNADLEVQLQEIVLRLGLERTQEVINNLIARLL